MELTESIISILLIIFGAGVMTLALLETRYLLKLVAETRSSQTWRLLSYLMMFFLVGYATIVVLISLEITSFILLIMGLVFFFGACFVVLVVKTGTTTIRELQQLSEQKIAMQHEKETAEAIAVLHSDFLDVMSHEFRTPLNAIIGFSQLLAMGTEDTDEQEYLANIQQGGEQLLDIVNQILEFSSLKTGKFTIDLQQFNLAEHLEAVTSQHIAQAPHLNIILWTDANCDRLICTDKDKLTEVLNYLLNNAVKFTPAGQILVAAIAQKDTLFCKIQDTGIGIPVDQIQRLFQPFSLGDNSSTRIHGGIGLGLILCQHLLEAMNGQIWLESNGILAGTPPDDAHNHLKTQLQQSCPQTLPDSAGTSIFINLPLQTADTNTTNP
ncbi:MAG: HAMP domain-containing sensor histidine kinase [Limnothrix sp.]